MIRPTLRRRLKTAVAATLTVAAALALATPSHAAAAAPGPAGKNVSYTIQDPAFVWTNNCARQGPRRTPLSGAGGEARVLTGIKGGASYQIEVPADWNGELVIYAHGYNGTGDLLCAGPPPAGLRQHYIDDGYAWAASSYATNGYDVAQGVKDSHALLSVFETRVDAPSRVYMTGVSMGGHITGVAIEQYRHAFDGAMPACGVMGDSELFDYFLDANVTAAALAGAPHPAFPADPAQYAAYVNSQVAPNLGSYTSPRLVPSSPAGQAWAAAVEQRSGGTRPGFAGAFLFWNAFGFGAVPNVPFLFGVYPGLTGGTVGIASGNVADNGDTVYQLDGDPALSAAEQQLNAAVLRLSADPQGRHPNGLGGIPPISGDISIPVVTLHDIGDLFVPFSMEQIYAQRVAEHGASGLLTQRAIRAVNHCDFTTAEYVRAFDDMVTQVKTGTKPAGDELLAPAVVAQPTYGCRFTSATRAPFFTACPAA
jgi:poly(3-hydroxybutyrate) depolymerase